MSYLDNMEGILADEIYGFLENEGIFVKKQKGCSRKPNDNGDQLYIDTVFLQEVKQRKKNLVM